MGIASIFTSNFGFSFIFLPGEKRKGMLAVYDFARYADDIADGAASSEEKRERLLSYRSALCETYLGRPADAFWERMLQSISRLGLSHEYFEAVLLGVEMDLEKRRYATFQELENYCDKVAVAVGYLCLQIFGACGPRHKQYAKNLGMAFQLTNILRDISEDARRDRLYIPREDFRRFGATEESVLEGHLTDPARALLTFEAARAQGYFHEAEVLLLPEDYNLLRSAEMMRRIYARLLRKIQQSQFDVSGGRIHLGIAEKIDCAAQVLFA